MRVDIFYRGRKVAVVQGAWPVQIPELSRAGWKFCMESNEPDSIILFGPRWQEVSNEGGGGKVDE